MPGDLTVRNPTPCAAARCRASQDADRVRKRCACGYAYYCDVECQREHRPAHKGFCKRLIANPEHAKVLTHLLRRTGLFIPDGENWQAVPAAYARGKPPLLAAPCTRYHLDKQAPSPQMSAELVQEATLFHDIVYGFMTPAQVRRVAEYMREHKLTQVCDPIAGTGLNLALMHIFGGVPVGDLDGSDLKPHAHASVWPVRTADALERPYDRLEETLVIVSWPDNQGAEVQLSELLLPRLHAMGAKHILVLSECPGCAFSVEGTVVLNRLYRCVENLGRFQIGKGAAEVVRSRVEDPALFDALEGSYGGIMDGTFQETYLYTRRDSPSAEAEAWCRELNRRSNAAHVLGEVHVKTPGASEEAAPAAMEQKFVPLSVLGARMAEECARL